VGSLEFKHQFHQKINKQTTKSFSFLSIWSLGIEVLGSFPGHWKRNPTYREVEKLVYRQR
jgi:hypothetical protein